MPIFEYTCSKGHKTDRVILQRAAENEPIKSTACSVDGCRCKAELIPSRTGTPILKAGKGGFYRPNAR